MFVSDSNKGYVRLDESKSTPILQILPEDKTIYFIKDQLSFNICWSVKHRGREIGKVPDNYISIGLFNHKNIVAVKLRIQEEMGIATTCITAKTLYNRELKSGDLSLAEYDCYFEFS